MVIRSRHMTLKAICPMTFQFSGSGLYVLHQILSRYLLLYYNHVWFSKGYSVKERLYPVGGGTGPEGVVDQPTRTRPIIQ